MEMVYKNKSLKYSNQVSNMLDITSQTYPILILAYH